MGLSAGCGRFQTCSEDLVFASITIRRLSAAGVYRYAAPQRCDKQCCARALMEVLGKADLEQPSERSGKLDEIVNTSLSASWKTADATRSINALLAS
jgi:hypothetical protein